MSSDPIPAERFGKGSGYARLILVHTVQLKKITKAQISGNLVSSGVSDVAIASVY